MAMTRTGKILIAIASLIALALLFIGLISLAEGGGYASQDNAILLAAISAISLLFLLLGLYSGYLFVRAVFRLLGKLAGFAGDTVPLRLISLGLTALIFPQVVREVIIAPVRFFMNFSAYFITVLNTSLSTPGGGYGGMDLHDLLRISLYTFRDAWIYLRNLLAEILIDLQIPSLMLALALWLILGQILSFVFDGSAGRGEERGGLPGFVRKLAPATRKNILLTAAFLVSGYLIMTSMIAVPWFQQTGKPNHEDWERELETIITTRDTIAQTGEEIPGAAPLDPLSDAFLDEKAALDTLPQWGLLLARVKSDRNELLQQRKLLADGWESLRESVEKRKSSLLSLAKISIKDTTISLGPRERASYYLEVSQWLSASAENLDAALKDYQNLLKQYDYKLENWVKDITAALASDAEKLSARRNSANPDSLEMVFESAYVYKPSLYTEDLFTGQSSFRNRATDPLPAPPLPGSQWGIFGLISRWLLRANSYALILITGMLGFGLFGSLISSIVREHSQRRPEEPLVKDLDAAVVRGLSAAVVVFLSVKGGLAVFTNQEVEPNSYVVFFTCLVGAVFSERIWEWAREWLKGKYGADGKAGGEAGDAAEAGESPDQAEEPGEEGGSSESAETGRNDKEPTSPEK
ncbi:MAG: hypothetical protein HUU32_10490 [Calditrichaceae bacterium]|nr:hypothetical protein [Calditrichia bacterium]NUQ41811.1 hypothetical protein [Calditrichaceae bacterium]